MQLPRSCFTKCSARPLWPQADSAGDVLLQSKFQTHSALACATVSIWGDESVRSWRANRRSGYTFTCGLSIPAVYPFGCTNALVWLFAICMAFVSMSSAFLCHVAAYCIVCSFTMLLCTAQSFYLCWICDQCAKWPAGISPMPDKTQTQSDCERELSFDTDQVTHPLEAIKIHPPPKEKHGIQAELSQSFQPDTPENLQDQELLHTLSTISTQSGHSARSRPDSSACATTRSGDQPKRFSSEAVRQPSGDSCKVHHLGCISCDKRMYETYVLCGFFVSVSLQSVLTLH